MNSLERNNSSIKYRSYRGIQNKKELSSLISLDSINTNKLRLLNLVDKNSCINILDKKLKKSDNEQTSSVISNNNRILNKFVINRINKENERELFKTNLNIKQIPNTENSKNNDKQNTLSIKCINSYRNKIFLNERNGKKKYVRESHQLLNSLLKNQNKSIQKQKILNSKNELSLSNSLDKDKKIKNYISSSKDSTQINNKIIDDSCNGELLFPRNIKKINQKNFNDNNLNDSNNENNIHSGINKENKDINLIKNSKEVLISPLYNLNNNDIKRNTTYKSPLRMADVLMLKKHHSINRNRENVITENNNIKDTFNKLKKIVIMKKEENKDNFVVENIISNRDLKINLINKEKNNKTDNKDINKNFEIISEKIENNEIKVNLKDNDKNNNNNINNQIYLKKKENIENKPERRNLIIKLPDSKYHSQTIDHRIIRNSSSLNNIKSNNDNNLRTISSIGHMQNNVNKDEIQDKINSIKIKVNKLKLEKTIEEKYDIKKMHSIRRKFMNSKNKYNNNFSPEQNIQKVINSDNNLKEININIDTNKKTEATEINNISNIIKKIKNNELNLIKINKVNNIETQAKDKVEKNETKINNDNCNKDEENENVPEIKFQSESEKEIRMKQAKKYQRKKEKNIICNTKNVERNINPEKKLKKYNSFSFGILSSLTEKIKKKRNNNILDNNEESKKEEKINLIDEENIIPNNDIKSRNLSPVVKDLKEKDIDLILNKEKMKRKNINSDKNINENIDFKVSKNIKTKKKVKISEEIKIEDINTAKPVIRYKIIELLHYNKLKENHMDKKYNNLFIFGIDKSNIIKFDLRKKRFNKIKISDIEDISDSFLNNYINENTIICNTFTGVFILTGKNTDILYYYDKKYEIIIKLCQFNSSHESGCLLLDKDKIFIFSGKKNRINEYYDFDKEKINNIPEFNYDRANSSFCFCNNKIYGLFGYSYIKEEYLLNILYIDKNKYDKWNEINLNIKESLLVDEHLMNISLFNCDKEPNKIFIYGGKKGFNQDLSDEYYYIYDIDKNIFEKIENIFFNIKKEFKRFTVKKNEEEKNKKDYFFDKQKQFIIISEEFELDKNNENIGVIIDEENNIHFLTKNRNYVNIFQFLK